MAESLKCQCCEHSLPGDGMYEICEECRWEQDSWPVPLDEYNVMNSITLAAAKKNYADYGACNPHGCLIKTGKYPEHDCATSENWYESTYERGPAYCGICYELK